MSENEKQQWLDTELMISIYADNKERVKALILAGANIKVKTLSGFSPLYIAVDKANIEMARLLIDLGADLDVSTNGYTPLHLASEIENLAMVDLLVTAGANIEAKTNYGYTPLHLVIEKQNFKIMDCLLKNKANLEEKTEEGYTALYIGIKIGNKEIVEFLLKAGADIEAKTTDGDTPLLFTIKIEEYELMEVLLKAGADVEAKTTDGFTSLFIAVEEGNLEMLGILLKAGADVEAKTNVGDNSLHFAIEKGKLKMVKALLKAGADFFSENAIEVSAFSAAEEQFGVEKIQKVVRDRLKDIFTTYKRKCRLLEKTIYNLVKESNNYNNNILTNLLFFPKKDDSLQGLIHKRILSDAGLSEHPLLKLNQEASKIVLPNSQQESNLKTRVKNFNKKIHEQLIGNLKSLEMVCSEEVSESLMPLEESENSSLFFQTKSEESENSSLFFQTNSEESLAQDDCDDSSFSLKSFSCTLL